MKNNLWCSIVGSHMWGMNHEQSDVDLCIVYEDSPDRILLGTTCRGGHNNRIGKYDIVKFELGHIVNELRKNLNVNFLWYVTSPIWKPCNERGNRIHEELNEVIRNNLSKEVYYSIAGMTRANLRKYFNIEIPFGEKAEPIEQKIHTDMPEWKEDKKKYLIIRTLIFGINMVLNRRIEYLNPKKFMINPNKPKMKSIFWLYNHFTDIFNSDRFTSMQEKTPKEPFNEFLINVRKERVKNG